jgi:hypothetical protein
MNLFILHELHTFNTKNIQNQESFQKQDFNNTLYSNHDSLQREVVSLKVTNTPLYTNQKETSQETS